MEIPRELRQNETETIPEEIRAKKNKIHQGIQARNSVNHYKERTKNTHLCKVKLLKTNKNIKSNQEKANSIFKGVIIRIKIYFSTIKN